MSIIGWPALLETHNVNELETLWDNTKEYIPIGAVTRDEFNSVKGHLIYIHGIFLEHLQAHSSKKGLKHKLDITGGGVG